MQLPSFLDVYRGLISTSSISSSDPSWDQGNQAVIEKLSDWFAALGFDVDVTEVEPGKYNLLAQKGQGEGGLLLAGHLSPVVTVPFLIKAAGALTLTNSLRKTTSSMVWAPPT